MNLVFYYICYFNIVITTAEPPVILFCDIISQAHRPPQNYKCKVMKYFDKLSNKFLNYIKNNLSADPASLYLQSASKQYDFPVAFAIEQIECRRKCAKKLSRYLQHIEFIFPTHLAAEQATHQCVAAYHAYLVGNSHNVIDITAGLGIDAFSFANGGNQVTAIELAEDRYEALCHNAAIVTSGDITIVHADSLAWIRENTDRCRFDYLFVDPARRDNLKRRTYSFADSLPDILTNFPLISSIADNIVIKASPLLDITQVKREIPAITSFHIVCIKGECKEVLAMVEQNKEAADPEIVAIDLNENREAEVDVISKWVIKMSQLSNDAPIADVSDLVPQAYIYDPNASIHKLNCSSEICCRFEGLKKISSNTELYCSTELHTDFPGRIFRIESILDKSAGKLLRQQRREVIVRNYPLTADQLRAKMRLKSGDEGFLIGCKVGEKASPTLMDCKKI